MFILNNGYYMVVDLQYSPTYSPTATKGYPMIRPDLRYIDLQYSPTYSPTATKGHPMIRPDLRCIDLQ